MNPRVVAGVAAAEHDGVVYGLKVAVDVGGEGLVLVPRRLLQLGRLAVQLRAHGGAGVGSGQCDDA